MRTRVGIGDDQVADTSKPKDAIRKAIEAPTNTEDDS
jgi:hypothetical protein